MSALQWMDRTFYPDYSDFWDDNLLRKRVLEHLRPDRSLLDLGAGAGFVTAMDFRGEARRICGIDPDPRVLENPYLNDARVGSGEAIPYPDSEFDVVVADNVLEHLPSPERVFREVHRVLKPGGVFLAKTPNRFHYVPLLAQLTPHWFHEWANSLRGRRRQDTFPTLYRANSRATLIALSQRTGFASCQLQRIEGRPEYLRVSAVTYLAGLAYERTVNAFDALAFLRVIILLECEK